MKKIKNYIGFVILLATLFSCNNSSTSEIETEEVTTQTPTEEVTTEATTTNTNETSETSNAVAEVKIGNQIWSTKNLDVITFINGDVIPEIKDPEEWEKAYHNQQPAWCYYDNKPENGKIYGKLYNWYAVIDSRGLIPEGWRIPTKEDWSELVDSLGGAKWAGQKLKSNIGWSENAFTKGKKNGSNSSKFFGNPGGRRGHSDYRFSGKGILGEWWGIGNYSDFDNSYENCLFSLTEDLQEVKINYSSKSDAHSIRCIKNVEFNLLTE